MFIRVAVTSSVHALATGPVSFPLLATTFQAASIIAIRLHTSAATSSTLLNGDCIHWLSPAYDLVTSVELNLNSASDLESSNGRPNAAFPTQNPLINGTASGSFEQLEEVASSKLRNQCQTSTGNALINQKAADTAMEKPKSVQLSQSMLYLECAHSK